MNKNLLKNIGAYAAIVLAFLVLSYAFVPQVLDGMIVNQSDISGWKGMAQESVQWNKEHPGDKALWSDSMFGGMPTVTFMDDFQGDWTKPLYKVLLLGKRPASYLFIALLGAFLMMLALGIDKYLSALGAFAVAFCSYNMQIIQVGHNTKMQAIAFAPWAIAALIYTYRMALASRENVPGEASGNASWKSWLPMTILGSVLFALALSMQIKANHVQITYYLAIIILFYGLATLIWVLTTKNKQLFVRFAAASALLLVMGIVGIGTNANKLMPTSAYAPFTMRGGSELVQEGDDGSTGLTLDYATAWSYGAEELPNMMIPNFNGGSSRGELSTDSAFGNTLRRMGANSAQVAQYCSQVPLYWGPQPFTAGPMYMGAITVFLFVLGLCLCQGRERWWLLACCIFAILLSLGNHLMWFTELMFKYAPMYNKFRTVSMALVVLQICMPLLGIYALDKILKGEVMPVKVVASTWISLAATAGFCILVALVPSLVGSFAGQGEDASPLYEALAHDRMVLLQKDAWRSALLILCSAAAIIFCYWKAKPAQVQTRKKWAVALIACLVVFDMWSVGKRYFNDEHFITPRGFDASFRERPADRQILSDKDPSYRVLDLTNDPFNSSVASFRHKSVGGYSPTKMQRYQDLIDYCLRAEISDFAKSLNEGTDLPHLPILNMLNTRYFIVSDKDVLPNDEAYGEAWFVDELMYAADANDEMLFLMDVQDDPYAYNGKPVLKTRAIVRADKVAPFSGSDINDAKITMTYYSPNELHYSYTCTEPSAVVFSEIYHPSWKATVNGEPLDLFQTDWVLRGAVLPAGEGDIVMRYEPEDYVTGRRLSTACSALLLMLLVLSSAFATLSSKAWKAMGRSSRILGCIAILLGVVSCSGNGAQPSMNDVIEDHVEVAKVQLKDLVEASETVVDGQRQILIPSKYEDGQIVFVPKDDWVSGFFAGTLWYMYELTGDEFWAEHAKMHTDNIEEIKHLKWHHDVGFMVYDSFGNGYRLKHYPEYEEVLLTTAASLSTRFRPAAGIIQSWNVVNNGWQSLRGWKCPVIIDNMMNLELLFKATEMSGDSTYYNIAVSHADKTLENHYREDMSCFHVVDYDHETGLVRRRCTAQGYSDDSAWARGQAWGIYGYTVAYRFTGDDRYLERAKAIENFIFTHPNLPEDLIPYWDFDAPEDVHGHPRDVSSATIIASALYELYGYTSEQRYLDEADTIIRNLSRPEYRAEPGTNGGFILKHSVGSIPHGASIDVPLNYADYYLLEALIRRKNIK